MQKRFLKLEKKTERENAIEDGAYDGRYKPKVFVDKKKKVAKRWARKKNLNFLVEQAQQLDLGY